MTKPTPLLLSQLNPDNNLQDALTRLESEVRSLPGSASRRWVLAEMLCVLGHWERALMQLQVGAKLQDDKDPQWEAKAHVLRSLIRAEAQRSAVFAGQLLPVPVIDRPQWMQDLAQAIGANARGDLPQADALRRAALDAAPIQAGVCTWQGEADQGGSLVTRPFDWMGDTDTRLGPVCECMLAGGYRWLAYADIASLHLEHPSSLLDLVWLPVRLQLRSTQTLRGYIPTRYSGTENTIFDIGSRQRDALLLSRLTRWMDVGETAVVALGQKMLMTQEGDIPLLRIRSLEMLPGANSPDRNPQRG